MKRPSRLRRLGAMCVRVALIALILAMTAYLTRRHWLEDLLIARAEAWLAEATAGSVSIEALDGNWIDTLVVRGLEVRDSEWLEIREGHFEAAIRLSDLVRMRWLDVLHGLRASADVIRVRIPPAVEDSTKESDSSVPDATWNTLAQIAPAGVRIDVGKCEIASEHGTRRGRLTAYLDQPSDRRRLEVGFAGLSAFGFVTRDRTASFDVGLSDPGGLLRAFGVDVPLHGGGASGRLEAEPDRVGATIEASGIEVADQGYVTAEARLELEPGARWHMPRFELSVPGGSVSARRVSIDDPRRTDARLATMTGEIVVQVDDARRFESLIPARLREFVPRRGWIAGSVDDRMLSVDDGVLSWRDDVTARITHGSIPIDDRSATGSLSAEARADTPFVIEVPDFGPIRLTGTASVELEGTLEHPAVSTRLGVGPGAFDRTTWTAVTGRLDVDPSGSVTYDVSASGVSDQRAPQVPLLAIGVAGSFEPNARAASLQLDIREESPPDRPPQRVVGPITWRDDRIEFTGLRCSGALAMNASGNVDLAARTLLASVEDLRADLLQLGRVFGQDLPPGNATGNVTLNGALDDPDGTVRLRVEVPDVRDVVVFEHEVFSAPTGAMALDLEVRRNASHFTVEQLTATVGDAIAFEAAGPLPLGWNGAELVLVQHPAPFSARVGARIDGRPGARIESLESNAEIEWTRDELRVRDLDVSAVVPDAPDQRVTGAVTFGRVAQSIVDGEYQT
ncbi:MAG: hypothetical protein KDB80_10925, partial [Planctomycetes bacterium]|nr:hypothetical protein [Planctomycetota bacterium]